MELSQKRIFISGIKAELPLLFGVFPFGMIYGVLATSAGLSPDLAQAMSVIIFAGSSQFIATQLLQSAVPGVVLITTIVIVNLRHLLYSASIAPHFKHLSTPWKFILAYFLTDEAYAVSILSFENNQFSKQKHWFFIGAGLSLWITWQISTAAGIFLGTTIPANWELDFTLALTFIALLVPSLNNSPKIIAAIVAGISSIATYHLPYKTGLFIAASIGILAGVILVRDK